MWWLSSYEVVWSHRCIRRGREAPLCLWSVYIWGIGVVGGPGSSCGSNTHVHSPTEYSYVADWDKSHRRSLCAPLPRREEPRGPSLELELLVRRPGASQIPSSPAPAPSEFLAGSSSVGRSRRGPPLPQKQRRWRAPSTKQSCSLAPLAGCQSPQCSRSTVSHWREVEDLGCRLSPVSTPLRLLGLCPPETRMSLVHICPHDWHNTVYALSHELTIEL